MAAAIAIVGMACCYPDARTPRQLWENVLAERQAFRRLPPERLNLEDYFSLDPHTPDAIYAAQAALIEGYEFDRIRFRVAGDTYRSADLTHWLALDVADQALEEAGFPEGKGLPKEATGVLLGNTLTGEFSRAALMRLRWPYVRRVVEARLREEGWDGEGRQAFLQGLEVLYKSPFPPVGEETLAGGLSNTIAGRICNHFNLQGGGYTVDGACSSSLLAVAQACSALECGELDAALVGGVDLSLDPFELIGFSKTGALARGEMRVYDRNSDGFLPGEGCGLVLLMRRQDALKRGLRCYALIRGWGVSSDGSGGLTRPEVEGQALALERAYRRAGHGIDTVALFEGHGTGTPVGDEVELRTLTEARRAAGPQVPPAVIGSIKANIGHTKAAAGIAGLIKSAMALHAQLIPPHTGVEDPHPLLEGDSPALRIAETGGPWPSHLPLRAGVSSSGFGGINVHVTLEGSVAARRRRLTSRERLLLGSAQDCELFLFGAEQRAGLLSQVDRLAELAPRLCYAELADLAAELAKLPGIPLTRAALIAASPQELALRLDTLRRWLAEGETTRIDGMAGVFLGAGVEAPRIAFLFPGQASPVRLHGGAWSRRFAALRKLYAKLPKEGDALAQLAVVTAELAGLRVLKTLGVKAAVAVGHSVGELSALHWAGAITEETLLRITRRRAQVMSALAGARGAMASLAADGPETERLLEGEEQVVIAGLNGPQQTVISGEAQAVARVLGRARAQGQAATLLPLAHAFHSPLMKPAAEALAGQLAGEDMKPLRGRVVSTISARVLAADEDLRSLLVRQLTSPVRFGEAVGQATREIDLCLEVGPGQILTGLLQASSNVPVLSLDAAGPSLRALLSSVGASYALGAPINRQALFADRFTRPFNPDRSLKFFVNPCERAPQSEINPPLGSTDQQVGSSAPAVAESKLGLSTEDPLALVRRLVAQRAELPLAAVKDEHRLLRDLHLNSISVGQLVAEAARQLHLPPPLAPTEYADASVFEIARALESFRAGGMSAAQATEPIPAGVDAWVRAFVVTRVETPLPAPRRKPQGRGHWRVFAPAEHPLAPILSQRLEEWGDTGILVCLPPQPDESHLKGLLDAAQAALGQEGAPCYFVLVQHEGVAASFARTLHQEAKGLTTCVVDVPLEERACAWVMAEIQAAEGFHEAYYDAEGRRSAICLRLLSEGETQETIPMGPADVLLVSGGGKGIAAECALALARESGVRLMLLGRSRPEEDEALASNLARLAAAGVRFRYQRADVTEAPSVRAAVVQGEQELGPVTAILHGAGVNRPQALRQLTEAAISATLAPKLQGLRNLLAAVEPTRLRLLVTFSSIIGRTGMQGEADYALANAWLTRMTEAFQAEHPACRCLALEWSIWSGVGMGERLGRVDALLRAGITPISVDAGVGWLRHLIACPPATTAVVISGRLGATPPLKLEGRDLPFLRFLEQPQVHYPGVELVVDAELSRTSDPYLEDHVFKGERLFPAVMGLEAMAQAAMAVLGETSAPGFEKVKFAHPIAVGVGARITLRIAALVKAPTRVDVVLRSSETAFQVDHFRATCRFGQRAHPPGHGARTSAKAPPHYLPLDPNRHLYGDLLFQSGRFRRLRAYRDLAATHCCADIDTDDNAPWFARYLPEDTVLGDPGSRDAAIHAIQACIPHALLLPIGVERLIPGVLHAPGPWTVTARERWQEGDVFCYDLELYGSKGELRERWEGLRLRRMAAAVREEWVEPLLAPYVERRVKELIPGSALSVALERNAKARRTRSDGAMQRALRRKARIRRRVDGKPETAGQKTISAAHSKDLTLAVAGRGPVACDLEAVVEREESIWQHLLGTERYALAERIGQDASEGIAAAATRVWAAQECLKKAGALVNTPLVLCSVEGDEWVVLGAGSLTIATYSAKLQAHPEPLVVAILTANEQGRSSRNSVPAEKHSSTTNSLLP